MQLNEVQLSPTKQESQQLDFSDEIVKEKLGNPVVVPSVETNGTSEQLPRTEKLLNNATELKQEATSKFDEESQSLENRIGIVLTKMATKMAKEIEALRNRVAYLEQKLEQKTQEQDTDSFDFGQVLSILERKQNDKDTT